MSLPSTSIVDTIEEDCEIEVREDDDVSIAIAIICSNSINRSGSTKVSVLSIKNSMIVVGYIAVDR